KCPNLVDDRRAPGDQAVTHAVDILQVQLVIGLNRDKAHVLPFDGLSDRLCIDEVVLVRLHEWLYKLSWDQPDIMALFAQCASEKMSPRAGLQSNQRCPDVRGIYQKLLPVKLLPHKHLARSAECHEMERCLAEVDAN